MPGLLVRIATFLAFSLNFYPSMAHEGHDHADDAQSALTGSAYPRVVAKSDQYELVGIVKDGRMLIYLDQAATNAPVADAKVNVTIGDGTSADAEPGANATYTVAFPATAARSVEVVFNLTAGSGDDLLVGALTFPAPAALVPAKTATGTALSRFIAPIPSPLRNPLALGLAGFVLIILCATSLRRGRRIAATAAGTAAAVVFVALAVISLSETSQGATPTPPVAAMSDAPRRLADGTAFVAKPTQRLLEVRTEVAKPRTVRPTVNLIGRVIGDPNRTSVVQSLYGGRIVPLAAGLPRIGQTVRKGDVLVEIEPHLPMADRTTISEKSGEIEQLIAVADARLRRLRPLAERGAIPQGQIADAENELEGLRRRREVVRSIGGEREPLRASTDGVIAAVKVTPGQVVQAQDLLMHIIDPKGLWVEALAYGAIDPDALANASAATTGGETMALAYQGFSRALQNHAFVLHFAIPEPPPNLSVGQPITVVATSGEPAVSGLIVRRDAVARAANGEAIVWLQADAERFEPRPVRTMPFDAVHLTIAGGVAEGERVVVRGADLINQIR